MNAPSPRSFWTSLKAFSGLVAYLALGIGIGVFFHYLLYRLSLPLQPFIYVAF
jgi:hypothetical protein